MAATTVQHTEVEEVVRKVREPRRRVATTRLFIRGISGMTPLPACGTSLDIADDPEAGPGWLNPPAPLLSKGTTA
jgi:hypothetical protein